MSELVLERATKQALDKIRHSKGFLAVYDLPSDLAEQAVWEAGRKTLDELGLPVVVYNQCRWLLREMARLFRTQAGWDLAFELEVFLRKWVGSRMDGALVQRLICDCWTRMKNLKAADVETEPAAGTV